MLTQSKVFKEIQTRLGLVDGIEKLRLNFIDACLRAPLSRSYELDLTMGESDSGLPGR